MAKARSDADRLCLLDLSSSVRVSLLQFSDDNKVKSSSGGMMYIGDDCISDGAEEIRSKWKTEFTLRSLHARGVVPIFGGNARQCDVYQGLGSPVDTAMCMTPLF